MSKNVIFWYSPGFEPRRSRLMNPSHSVVSKLLWPFHEDVCRFDFETTDEDSSKSLV